MCRLFWVQFLSVCTDKGVYIGSHFDYRLADV